MLYEYMIHYSV